MAWVTPVTSWAPNDAVDENDLNRIEGNTAVNRVPDRGMIDGFVMAYGKSGDAFSVIFGKGLCCDSTNTYRIESTTSFSKRVIDATGTGYSVWSTGSATGGVATGVTAIADGNWLYAFVIGQSADPTQFEFGFDSSMTAANLLSGSWDVYRRVGSVKIESLGGGKFGIQPFISDGEYFEWIESYDNGIPLSGSGGVETTQAVDVPPGFPSRANLDVVLIGPASSSAAAYVITSQAATALQKAPRLRSDDAARVSQSFMVITNSSQLIRYAIDTGAGSSWTFDIYTRGYWDRRGNDE